MTDDKLETVTGATTDGTLQFTPREMMAIAAGRFISDGDVLFAGTGVALLAAGCAKRVHAPASTVFVETGGIDPSLDEIPLAVADSRVMDGTCINAGIISRGVNSNSPSGRSVVAPVIVSSSSSFITSPPSQRRSRPMA